MEQDTLKKIIEGALLAAGEPLSLQRLLDLFEESERPDREQLVAALDDIAADCQDRAVELKQTASGYRFQVRQELSRWVGRLWEEKPRKYSRALLETLALIAYRQPITRGDIEQIRGVAVSSDLIRTLVEREWVRVVGHRDVPGRPALYATTRQFLDYFNLRSLDELPPLDEIRDLDEFNPLLDFSPEGESNVDGADTGERDSDSDASEPESRPSAQVVTLPLSARVDNE
ncbi:MAG: SMC-Scp complex subunit ScpB [Porticoccaceae bacterium]|nr:SMC-Scp complex subunit ScpB [Porticoccaceae bacterium]